MVINYREQVVEVEITSQRDGQVLVQTTDGSKPFRAECVSPRQIISVDWAWVDAADLIIEDEQPEPQRHWSDDPKHYKMVGEQSCPACRRKAREVCGWIGAAMGKSTAIGGG